VIIPVTAIFCSALILRQLNIRSDLNKSVHPLRDTRISTDIRNRSSTTDVRPKRGGNGNVRSFPFVKSPRLPSLRVRGNAAYTSDIMSIGAAFRIREIIDRALANRHCDARDLSTSRIAVNIAALALDSRDARVMSAISRFLR